MELISTHIHGLYVIETNRVSDDRGYFYRAWDKNLIIEDRQIDFVHYNVSHNNNKGTIRGMHLQLYPNAEIKLVRCIRGSICDVAIDLRKDSETFLQHFSIELNDTNGKALLIPEGCAHGFQTLKDDSTLLYMHSKTYNSSSEYSVSWCEPRVNISWPLELSMISDKDRNVKFLERNFTGI